MARTPIRHTNCPRCGAQLARDNTTGRCAPCQSAERDRLVSPPTLPEDFWDHEPIRQALAERHLGKVIRAYRHHPYHGHDPLPQETVGRWLGITQAQMSRLENGRPVVHLDRLAHWAQTLRIPGHLLWFDLPHAGRSAEGGIDTKSTAEGHPSRADRPNIVENLLDRHQPVRALGSSAPGAGFYELFTRTAAEAMEFTQRAEASDIGPRTMEHLELAIAGMAGAFAHTPPEKMFQTATVYRRQVASFIEGKQTLRQKRELYRYAGWLSIILGWLSHDLGDPLAAETHCLDAWEHGWQAEDGEICGWAMDTTATIAMYSNRPEQARDAALKGLDFAPDGSAAAARLSCQLTRAYGRLRQSNQFDSSLAETRRRIVQLPQQGSGLFAADVGRVASYAATSSIWLDRPTDAVRYAQEALNFYAEVGPAERSPTREAISRLDLALALIAMNTPDGAAEQVLQALNTDRVTGTVLARANEVNTALQQSHSALPATRDVNERYRELIDQRRRPQLLM